MEGEDGDAEIDVFSSLTTNPRFNPFLGVADDEGGSDDDDGCVYGQGGAQLGVADDEGGGEEEGGEQGGQCSSTVASTQVLLNNCSSSFFLAHVTLTLSRSTPFSVEIW